MTRQAIEAFAPPSTKAAAFVIRCS